MVDGYDELKRMYYPTRKPWVLIDRPDSVHQCFSLASANLSPFHFNHQHSYATPFLSLRRQFELSTKRAMRAPYRLEFLTQTPGDAAVLRTMAERGSGKVLSLTCHEYMREALSTQGPLHLPSWSIYSSWVKPRCHICDVVMAVPVRRSGSRAFIF